MRRCWRGVGSSGAVRSVICLEVGDVFRHLAGKIIAKMPSTMDVLYNQIQNRYEMESDLCF